MHYSSKHPEGILHYFAVDVVFVICAILYGVTIVAAWWGLKESKLVALFLAILSFICAIYLTFFLSDILDRRALTQCFALAPTKIEAEATLKRMEGK